MLLKSRNSRPRNILEGVLGNALLNSRFTLLAFGAVLCGISYLAGQYHLVLSAIVIMTLGTFWKETDKWLRWGLKQLPVPTRVLTIGAIALIGVIHFLVLPADAAFLGDACGLLRNVFSSAGATSTTGVAVDPVQITINIIRAMFIIYLAIALIQVFNQMRRDEDWQMAVRAPVLAVLVIVIVDVISATMISGLATTITQC